MLWMSLLAAEVMFSSVIALLRQQRDTSIRALDAAMHVAQSIESLVVMLGTL